MRKVEVSGACGASVNVKRADYFRNAGVNGKEMFKMA
jgi:hypothetical protein